MPNFHELIVALQLSKKIDEHVWLCNFDLQNAHGQLKLCEKTSKQ